MAGMMWFCIFMCVPFVVVSFAALRRNQIGALLTCWVAIAVLMFTASYFAFKVY